MGYGRQEINVNSMHSKNSLDLNADDQDRDATRQFSIFVHAESLSATFFFAVFSIDGNHKEYKSIG
jgi:hypothetical protein